MLPAPRHAGRARVPRSLKLAYGLGVPLTVLVYKRRYGTGNFLWLSEPAR